MSEIDNKRVVIEARMTDQERQSVDILRYLSDAVWFEKNGENVDIYLTEEARSAGKPHKKVSPEDVFLAVDYYYKNRASEQMVNFAMQQPEGKVDVFSPHNPEDPAGRVSLLSIKNYMVPQILEFAYLLARAELKEK